MLKLLAHGLVGLTVVGDQFGAVDLSFGSKVAHLRTEMGDGVFSFAPETGVVHTDPAGRVTRVA